MTRQHIPDESYTFGVTAIIRYEPVTMVRIILQAERCFLYPEYNQRRNVAIFGTLLHEMVVSAELCLTQIGGRREGKGCQF